METTEDNSLKCPRCGNDYLHHAIVEVYSRPIEDGPSTATLVMPTGITVQRYGGKGNPSSRRDGLRITFWCEGCDDFQSTQSSLVLTFAQHKGRTLIEWENDYHLDPISLDPIS